MLKFNKYHVTDGKIKARVRYSLDNRTDGRRVVTLYARDYSEDLAQLFTDGTYENRTDLQGNYFEKGTVRIFQDHPLYSQARARAESLKG